MCNLVNIQVYSFYEKMYAEFFKTWLFFDKRNANDFKHIHTLL